MPDGTVRAATTADDPAIGVIAAEGDAVADAAYLALLRSQDARLLVMEVDDEVVAFGATVELEEATMLTDLFVAGRHRGTGRGGCLLEALLGDRPRRMTFSSAHPAAHAAYERAGMQARWRLLYLEGRASGGGALPATGTWGHERTALIAQWQVTGALVFPDLVLVPTQEGYRIARLHHDAPVAPVALVEEVLAGVAAGATVTMCAPEHSALAAWALGHGFRVTDHDTFRATAGVELPAGLHVLDPGLA